MTKSSGREPVSGPRPGRDLGRRLARAGRGPALAFGLVLAGCAGTFQPMGDPMVAPAVTDDAYRTVDGVELAMRSWLPEGEPEAVVLALHGFNDYSNAFDAPGRHFAENGIATYAYDQRGFGANGRPGIWATADTLIADLYGAVSALRREHPGVPLHVLGESMGGAVVLAAMAEPPPDGYPPLATLVDGAILSAPAVWDYDSMSAIQRAALWITSRTVPWLTLTAPPELRIVPSDNIEMLRALGRDPLVIKRTRADAIAGLTALMTRAQNAVPQAAEVPMLVMYGRNEQVIPAKPIDRALAALPDRHTVAVYEKGYHMLLRDLNARTVWEDVVAWIARPRAPLPSGADRVPWRDEARRAQAG